ncbi:MAG TPA: MauE/DoxX family redox-associated membrane protein [Ktedonosporobacter sp.]|jgi:hypothetical protein|nr:MauE/DoxX family redox-associated membrane protein [Ktedonosporobacter sp.]
MRGTSHPDQEDLLAVHGREGHAKEEHTMTTSLMAVHFFLRLFLGMLFLSTSLDKFTHRSRLQRGIQDYHVLPTDLDTRWHLTSLASVCIPVIEGVTGVGFLSGWLASLWSVLCAALLLLFSGAIVVNLLRGRMDLSCHCGGVLGEHYISWWMVGRNGLLMGGLLLLALTAPDPLMVTPTLFHPSAATISFFLNIGLPLLFVVFASLIVVFMMQSIPRILFHRGRSSFTGKR